MAKYNTDRVTVNEDGKDIDKISTESIENFNESVLGLGNIDSKSTQVNALSVMFDLEGFTNFCKQIDPHLAIPEFLDSFLKWLFMEIKNTLCPRKGEDFQVWADLPFLSKYTGDGVLFLWDTEKMKEPEILNIVATMDAVCENYIKKFLPEISKNIISPPIKLRCGIARGIIYSVGDGNDYVGPCINMSARLQKLHSLSFCFSRRGINLNKMHPNVLKDYIVKKVDIRGIGSEELVCILKKEYDKLPEADKSKFFD